MWAREAHTVRYETYLHARADGCSSHDARDPWFEHEGAARVKELTGGLGAHSVVEAVGNQVSMSQAIASTRPGGHVGFVGVGHDQTIDGGSLFFAEVHLHGGPAPVRRFLPDLIDRILRREIDPGRVFTMRLPLDRAAEGYRAMDERRAIKVLLEP